MGIIKRLFAAALSGVIVISAGAVLPIASLNADAATWAQITADNVFLKQEGRDTCTLCANTMLLRRTALMRGDSDWSTITESSCRSQLWLEDVGMYNSYTYRNISVTNQRITGSVRTTLINALNEHPEGIVIYDYGYPHAILLTDYTDGVFYCAEPAPYTPEGRIPASEAIIDVEDADAMWYVTSPKVSYTGGKTVEEEKKVHETWKVNSYDGVNLRSGAGTGYNSLGVIPRNTILLITKIKKSGGYTWGYTSYNSKNGWIALDHAVKVTVPSLVNNSSLSATAVTLTDSVKIKGAASGGTGIYQYAFFYKKSSSSSWTTVRDYSSTASVSITPSAATVYDVCVKVRDSAGTVVKKYLSFQVNKKFENKSKLSATKVDTGSTITVTGAASGGTAPYKYAYYYKKSSSSNWLTISDFSDTNTAYVTPAAATDYDVCVKVKDSTGKIVKKYMSFTAEKAMTNTSRLSASVIYKGESIKLKGSAEGGNGGYTFAYYYKSESAASWKTLLDFSKETSAQLVPGATGKYEVCIKAKDSTGKTVKKYLEFNVRPGLSNTSKLSASEIYKGESIKLKGSAVGGNGGYTFAYLYKSESASSWKTLLDFSTETSAQLVPGATGKYEVCIKAKDSTGKTVKKYLEFNVRPGLSNTSKLSTNSAEKGSKVYLRGSATGGSGSYSYAFYYKKSSASSWTTLYDFSSTKTVSFNTEKAGKYDICIKVKDSAGHLEKKYLKLTVTE